LDEIVTLSDTAIITLSSHAADDIHSLQIPSRAIFVLGNESGGVSESVMRASTHSVSIPMHRGVESLNVAVTAGIVSFLP
jgi:23S rRNA (guanosine2251-2'-O)-methyltransferase